MERAHRLTCAVAALSVLVMACQPRFSEEAARSLEGQVILLRPSKDGLEPVTVARQPLPSVKLPSRKAVEFSPDLSTYIERSVKKDVFTMTLVRPNGSRALLAEPFDPTAPTKPVRIDWLKPDGSELLVLIGNRLMRFRDTPSGVEKTELADGVQGFARSDNDVFVLRHAQNGGVIESLETGKSVPTGTNVTTLFPSPNRGEVIGVARSESPQLVVISPASGTARSVPLTKLSGELRSIIPLAGGQVLVETWDGEERVDGTELSTFSICDLQGRCSFAFADDEHVRVHRLASQPPTTAHHGGSGP